MRRCGIILVMMAFLALAPAAMASTQVILSIDGGAQQSYDLGSFTIDPTTGNITLSVTGGGNQSCTNTPPAVTFSSGAVIYATTNTQVSATLTVTDAEQTSLLLTKISGNGTLSGTAWSWTPASAGDYLVTFQANDQQSCNNLTTVTLTVKVSAPVGTGEPSGVETLVNNQAVKNVTVPAHTQKYYKFVLTKTSYVQANLLTNDWITNQDMVIKQGLPVPGTSDYTEGIRAISYGPTFWYAISPNSSNETLFMSSAPAGTYYIMINNTSGIAGKFTLGYSAY